jgi:beta-glucanase (GH16 family)
MLNKITKSVLFLLFVNISLAQVDVVYNDLVWSDEFDTNGAVNATNWFHQTQLIAGDSWANGEEQHYTNEITNSFIENGVLKIIAKKEPYTNQGVTKQYTSARLNSKFAFTYGRVDIRAKIPTNQGTWPALWMLGKNINEQGGYFNATHGTTNWPACGEIDIMEHGITSWQPAGFVQSAIHTTSSSGATINHGGTIANNLGTAFHVYSMNWSPNQITFLLDGVAFYTYNPTVKTPSNWPFTAEQYLLLNIAMGGVAGVIPSNFTQATMEIDYVRVYQNVAVDNQIPTNFTATVGNVTSSSVELLLNANENSGSVVYDVTYGTLTNSTIGSSGLQKSFVITGLSPNTNYTFSVAASDVTGNEAANNSIILTATTLSVTACSGSDTAAQEGSFTAGYNYEFETIGTDVKITFEMLDTNRVGVVAFLRKQAPFSETQMANVSGRIFTHTITGQTIGATINYAVKFAYANGLSVTRYISYVVGSNCALHQENFNEFTDFTYSNPANNYITINATSKIDKVEIYNLIGNKIISQATNTNLVEVATLSEGIYLMVVYSGNRKGIKKVIIN